MKRREFIKAAAAAAGSPLLPARVASVFPDAIYAKATHAANTWAYMTAGNLKRALGVDERTSHGLIERLRADGVLGETGADGIAVSRKFLAQHTKITTPGLRAAKAASTQRDRPAYESEYAQSATEPEHIDGVPGELRSLTKPIKNCCECFA